ncbi:hypothetical protein J437_LFUL018800 [Ladona fulva]|uniref:Myeloid differentiation primary response protein MyD88 n=1 Tax=Ladona fulva TaxID=123851 RepID=A0A8K0P8Y9_LADFU|nr:hypothetical protein J437_LFUL018800 [Ladona fulva]
MSVPEEVQKCPVHALRLNTIAKISNSLNSNKILPTDDGFLRDWRGLAQLAGIDVQIVMNIASKSDPTAEFFKSWSRIGDQEKSVSVGLLLSFLRKMDRWDAIDDTTKMIGYFGNVTEVFCVIELIFSVSDDVCRLDKGLLPQNYDAYLLFAEDDADFAMQIIDRMENEYKLKLCVKDRDLVGGLAFEHEAIMKLIAERCNRLIVVVSPNFLKSEANKFFVTFAQALGIDQRQRKVVPCLYQRCQLPPELSYYFLLDYNRAGKFWNFWEKLRDSILAPNSAAVSSSVSESNLTGLNQIKDNVSVSMPCKKNKARPMKWFRRLLPKEKKRHKMKALEV